MNGSDNSGYERLEDQIEWYDRKSIAHQRAYRRLKLVSICAAALVPLAAYLTDLPFIVGALGVIVVVVEGVLEVNQHQRNWIRYRTTCESLKHEKYRYLARTGPYAASDTDAYRELVERVEILVSQENSVWVEDRRQVAEAQAARRNAEVTARPGTEG